MNDKKDTSEQEKPGGIDWGGLHRCVEITRTALELGFQPTREEKKKILRARAKMLSSESERKAHAGESIEVVEFLLAHEKYAVVSDYVREVYPLKEFTPIPCTPPFVLGIINVRGQILSVIDIKKFFNLPEKGLTDLNKVIIFRSKDMEFGILADVVVGARTILLGELQSSLPTLTGIREGYLKGVTNDRVVILDAEKLLSDNNIVVHEQIDS